MRSGEGSTYGQVHIYNRTRLNVGRARPGRTVRMPKWTSSIRIGPGRGQLLDINIEGLPLSAAATQDSSARSCQEHLAPRPSLLHDRA
jgi:hypothetical protein